MVSMNGDFFEWLTSEPTNVLKPAAFISSITLRSTPAINASRAAFIATEVKSKISAAIFMSITLNIH